VKRVLIHQPIRFGAAAVPNNIVCGKLFFNSLTRLRFLKWIILAQASQIHFLNRVLVNGFKVDFGIKNSFPQTHLKAGFPNGITPNDALI
jgi:hypothetical protein